MFVSDEWKLFLRAKKFEEQNFSSNGVKVVTEMDNDAVSVTNWKHKQKSDAFSS